MIELNYIASCEDFLCIVSLGIDSASVDLYKYVVCLKWCIKPNVYRTAGLGFVNYDIAPFPNFVNTIKIKNRRACTICCNTKKGFKSCYRCKSVHCSKCFYTRAPDNLTCIHCRYAFYDHIN
jgi:hypothetical protein